MRPMRLISFTTPDPTNTAQALIAEAKISGVESAEKAGVSAAVIGAWYCSNRRAPSKSGSGDSAKIYEFSQCLAREIMIVCAYLDNVSQDCKAFKSNLHDMRSGRRKRDLDEV